MADFSGGEGGHSPLFMEKCAANARVCSFEIWCLWLNAGALNVIMVIRSVFGRVFMLLYMQKNVGNCRFC